jgi:hypothetical protein
MQFYLQNPRGLLLGVEAKKEKKRTVRRKGEISTGEYTLIH